jgi:hypothetical protein
MGSHGSGQRHAPAICTQAVVLTVHNGLPDLQTARDIFAERLEYRELAPVTADQFAGAVLSLAQCAEPVMLQPGLACFCPQGIWSPAEAVSPLTQIGNDRKRAM